MTYVKTYNRDTEHWNDLNEHSRLLKKSNEEILKVIYSSTVDVYFYQNEKKLDNRK